MVPQRQVVCCNTRIHAIKHRIHLRMHIRSKQRRIGKRHANIVRCLGDVYTAEARQLRRIRELEKIKNRIAAESLPFYKRC